MKKVIIIILVLVLGFLSVSAKGRLSNYERGKARVELSSLIYQAQKVLNPIFAESGKAYLSNAKVREVLGAEYEAVSKAMSFLIKSFNRSGVNGSKEKGVNIDKLKWGKRFANFATICYIKTTKIKFAHGSRIEKYFTWRTFKQRQEMEAKGHKWEKY